MKRPKEPKNLSFWLDIIKDEKLVQDFLTRGNPIQKKAILQAMKWAKWRRIQGKLI